MSLDAGDVALLEKELTVTVYPGVKINKFAPNAVWRDEAKKLHNPKPTDPGYTPGTEVTLKKGTRCQVIVLGTLGNGKPGYILDAFVNDEMQYFIVDNTTVCASVGCTIAGGRRRNRSRKSRTSKARRNRSRRHHKTK